MKCRRYGKICISGHVTFKIKERVCLKLRKNIGSLNIVTFKAMNAMIC